MIKLLRYFFHLFYENSTKKIVLRNVIKASSYASIEGGRGEDWLQITTILVFKLGMSTRAIKRSLYLQHKLQMFAT